MSRYGHSKGEKEINVVLAHQDDQIKSIMFPSAKELEERIASSEELLASLGYDLPQRNKGAKLVRAEKPLLIPVWDQMLEEALRAGKGSAELEDLFTEEELQANREAVLVLNEQYNQIHRMDAIDVAIVTGAGLLAVAVDILLVGIPQKTHDGLKAGPLSDYIRGYFDKRFPSNEMEKLANSKVSKVPYDAQDNRNTATRVEGLSAYYHRLLSLGHDPLLGFVFGVSDILTGRMTTIDKNGKVVSQVMECYSGRKEADVFAAIAKQVIHLKSDVTTSMGLPAPFMGLFNLIQFGSIGEAEQTVAEIVQGMYYEGYDFIHFCSTSVPVAIVEVMVRLCYAIRRIKEGAPIKDAIPFSANRSKNPKLATMLFTAHCAATAVNAGKVVFTKDPMAINYPQWIAFAKYSYQQLKWTTITKPAERDRFVRKAIEDDLFHTYDDVDSLLGQMFPEEIAIDQPNPRTERRAPGRIYNREDLPS